MAEPVCVSGLSNAGEPVPVSLAVRDVEIDLGCDRAEMFPMPPRNADPEQGVISARKFLEGTQRSCGESNARIEETQAIFSPVQIVIFYGSPDDSCA